MDFFNKIPKKRSKTQEVIIVIKFCILKIF